MSWSC